MLGIRAVTLSSPPICQGYIQPVIGVPPLCHVSLFLPLPWLHYKHSSVPNSCGWAKDLGETSPPHCAQLPLLGTVGSSVCSQLHLNGDAATSSAGQGNCAWGDIDLLAGFMYVCMYSEYISSLGGPQLLSVHMHLGVQDIWEGTGKNLAGNNHMQATEPHRILHQSFPWTNLNAFADVLKWLPV